MLFFSMSPPSTKQNITEINPVYAHVIGKLNNPTAHNLVFNSDEVASTKYEEPNYLSKIQI